MALNRQRLRGTTIRGSQRHKAIKTLQIYKKYPIGDNINLNNYYQNSNLCRVTITRVRVYARERVQQPKTSSVKPYRLGNLFI